MELKARVKKGVPGVICHSQTLTLPQLCSGRIPRINFNTKNSPKSIRKGQLLRLMYDTYQETFFHMRKRKTFSLFVSGAEVYIWVKCLIKQLCQHGNLLLFLCVVNYVNNINWKDQHITKNCVRIDFCDGGLKRLVWGRKSYQPFLIYVIWKTLLDRVRVLCVMLKGLNMYETSPSSTQRLPS